VGNKTKLNSDSFSCISAICQTWSDILSFPLTTFSIAAIVSENTKKLIIPKTISLVRGIKGD
jgi:hypothetical protein